MKTKNIIKTFIFYGFIIIKNIFNRFRKKFNHISVRENTVLVAEFLTNHGEVLPGLIKYLLDLNYNVDVVLSKTNISLGDNRNDIGLFSPFNGNNRVDIKFLSSCDINLLLRSPAVANYKHIIINTFYDGNEYTYLYRVNLFTLKPVFMMHNPDISNDYFKNNKKISLVKMDYNGRSAPFVVNSHYFGEFLKSEKSDTTVFFALNTNQLFRRNPYLLFDACNKLYEKGIHNFSIKIVGKGVSIPDKYRSNFTVFGFLDFQKMFKEIASSDFVLALIDQASVEYTNKASGSYQLSYGFLKPIVLHQKFSDVADFNNENSILYDDNNYLADAMERCIHMSKDDYSSLVCRLETSEKQLYDTSLNNLKMALDATE